LLGDHSDKPLTSAHEIRWVADKTVCQLPGFKMHDVTQVLAAIERGDPAATEKLLPLVYEELRVLAHHRLAAEKSGQTLQATALVHEAYLRLVGDGQQACEWSGRGHFFAAASEAMRRILVENARRKNRFKRGGDLTRIDVDIDSLDVSNVDEDLLAAERVNFHPLHNCASTTLRSRDLMKFITSLGYAPRVLNCGEDQPSSMK
jgi:RNA polymerase sigma factor (TIGR02999 family)